MRGKTLEERSQARNTCPLPREYLTFSGLPAYPLCAPFPMRRDEVQAGPANDSKSQICTHTFPHFCELGMNIDKHFQRSISGYSSAEVPLAYLCDHTSTEHLIAPMLDGMQEKDFRVLVYYFLQRFGSYISFYFVVKVSARKLLGTYAMERSIR